VIPLPEGSPKVVILGPKSVMAYIEERGKRNICVGVFGKKKSG